MKNYKKIFTAIILLLNNYVLSAERTTHNHAIISRSEQFIQLCNQPIYCSSEDLHIDGTTWMKFLVFVPHQIPTIGSFVVAYFNIAGPWQTTDIDESALIAFYPFCIRDANSKTILQECMLDEFTIKLFHVYKNGQIISDSSFMVNHSDSENIKIFTQSKLEKLLSDGIITQDTTDDSVYYTSLSINGLQFYS